MTFEECRGQDGWYLKMIDGHLTWVIEDSSEVEGYRLAEPEPISTNNSLDTSISNT